jgi:protein TonB
VVQTIPTALPIFHDKVLIPPPPHVVSVAQTHTVPPAHPKSATPKQSNDLARGSSTPSVDELHNTPPDYPPESQAAGENGTVMLLVMVSAKGEPDKVSIMKSSGYFRLDQAAREAVRQWKFHPAVVAGVDVPGPVTVPVLFHLNPGN